MDTLQDFLTVNDVIQKTKLDVTDQTIRRWIREGKLKAVKVNNSFLISKKDLEQFLEARQGGTNETKRLNKRK